MEMRSIGKCVEMNMMTMRKMNEWVVLGVGGGFITTALNWKIYQKVTGFAHIAVPKNHFVTF